MTLEFEWDDEKSACNVAKHGIAFEEARTAFFDPMRVDLYDMKHSLTEDRWKVLGIAGFTLIMVNYTERDGVFRIISARKATLTEEEAYFYGYSTFNRN